VRILHTVQRYAPDSGGSEEVVRQLSEYLVSFGHEVTVATSRSARRGSRQINGVRIEEFNCAGNSVDGIRGEVKAYQNFILQADVDIMMNYAAQIWSSDLVFDLLPSLRKKKVLLPCGYSQLHNPAYREYFDRMPDILRLYDKVIYLSDNYIDKDFADRHGLTNHAVIPNGADKREFTNVPNGAFRNKFQLDGRPILLNVSNHSLLKNHSFFWNCLRMLDRKTFAPVLIASAYRSGPSKWLTQCYAACRWDAIRLEALILENLPRSEVVKAFVDADIFIFGSKIECSPLVMFEAFAGKTLFITTDCGNVKDYSDIVCIVRNEHEAVEIVKDFYYHPEAYTQRLERGYANFLQKLNWEYIARQYEQLYAGLLDSAAHTMSKE